MLLIFLSREAVFRGSGVQGMYQLLPGFLQPGANVHRQQAGMSGWMLLSRWWLSLPLNVSAACWSAVTMSSVLPQVWFMKTGVVWCPLTVPASITACFTHLDTRCRRNATTGEQLHEPHLFNYFCIDSLLIICLMVPSSIFSTCLAGVWNCTDYNCPGLFLLCRYQKSQDMSVGKSRSKKKKKKNVSLSLQASAQWLEICIFSPLMDGSTPSLQPVSTSLLKVGDLPSPSRTHPVELWVLF